MPCYRPLPCWYGKNRDPVTGKRPIVFSVSEALVDRPLSVPCGQCVGCRLDKSFNWAIRCSHEAALYDDNCFLTLTYDDEAYPANGSLEVSHLQNFMKRFRKAVEPLRIRFFACGEYGEICWTCKKSRVYCRCECFIKSLGRPHYHLLIFGFNFPDRVLFKKRPYVLFTSEMLSSIWEDGFSTIGDLTFESASYVARYAVKKRTGYMAKYFYCDYDDVTGEVYNVRRPEFGTMSLKPGIGARWFERFREDVFPSDEVVVRGRSVPVPRYYDQLLSLVSEDLLESVKRKRKRNAGRYLDNNTSSRHKVRETVAEAKLALYKRNLEDGNQDVCDL